MNDRSIDDCPSKAAQVFAIPELLEIILLSLPATTNQQELSSIRTIITSRSTSKTWHALINDSIRIRTFCYLPTKPSSPSTPPSQTLSSTPSHSPQIRPNPWIPSLLLHQQTPHSTTTWPFTSNSVSSRYGPTPTPQHWSLFLEVSRSQHARFPPPGPWREMLATDPPFEQVWCTTTTKTSGVDAMLYLKPHHQTPAAEDFDDSAAPYEAMDDTGWTAAMEAGVRFKGYRSLRGKQRAFRRWCEGGFTLGAIVDAVGEGFGRDGRAGWVVVESLREGDVGLEGGE